jgi:hypothetical protein
MELAKAQTDPNNRGIDILSTALATVRRTSECVSTE